MRSGTQFSVLLPLRDTVYSLKLAKKQIPSVLKLKPDEMGIGIDAPADIEFVGAIRKIFDKSNAYTHLNITQVDRDAAWCFGLAKVTWELYRAVSHDITLMTNVDSVLEPAAIYGRDVVGTDNIAGVALLSRPLVRTVSDVVRYVYWYLVCRPRLRFTGLFWIYLPYYFDFIDVDGFKKIQNGTDTFMWECLEKTNDMRQ